MPAPKRTAAPALWQQHPAVAPSTLPPKRTHHANKSTLLEQHPAAAPCTHQRSKAHTRLWQQHPQAAPCSGTSTPAPRKRTQHPNQHPAAAHPAVAPACPLQSADTTLTAASPSRSRQRHQHARSKTQTCNSSYTWSKNLKTSMASLSGDWKKTINKSVTK